MSRLNLTVMGILFLAVLQNAQSSEADFSFDIDGDGETEALTDGLLVLRYLFGFSGTTLSEGAVSSSAARADAGDISAYLSTNLAQLDIDGDGETGALTDGLLLLRYLFGFRDETLIAGALSSSATRDSSSEIETYTAGRIVDTASIFGIDRRTNFAGVVVPTDSTEPGSISVAETFSGLTFELPVFLAAVPDEDRLIVVEQKGRVYVFENDSDVSIKNTLLDLSEVVLFEGGYDEQGLLGFAFDPNFSTNRYVYVHYSAASPRRSIVSRFRWDAATDRVVLDTEKQLLWVAQPYSNHNGGMLAFGPLDGYMYIAFGDGGSGGDPDGNGQNGMTLLGTILRIDVHPQDPTNAYDIPLDNPFRDNENVRDEIYAMGLRNPWRFSFDRQKGDLWAADVGQNRLEEIDIVEAGENYGWCAFEGTERYAGCSTTLPDSSFVPPIHEYGRTEGASITGGYVYRGTQLPSLFGTYVYGDFVSGSVWSLGYGGSSVLFNTTIGTIMQLASFGEGNDGELFLIARSGEIYGLEESSGGSSLPTKLSSTNIFSDLITLAPAPGFIEYDVNVSSYSSGAKMRRWLAIPNDSGIDFNSTGRWVYPSGSVLVQHFEMQMDERDADSMRRLETRVLVRRVAGDWTGYTYRWNESETEAVLVGRRETESLLITSATGGITSVDYDFLSSSDCLMCHNNTAGFALGAKTRQLNRDFAYATLTDNQLRSYNHIDLFSVSIKRATEYEAFKSTPDAREYLDVNCSNCHRPSANNGLALDFRVDTDETDMGVVDVAPIRGDLGIASPRLVDPGSKETSIVWERMRVLGTNAMPPVAKHRVDEVGIALIGAWIDAM